MVKLICIVGARPNFMKAAPIIHQLKKNGSSMNIKAKLVHTGQHYDKVMSQVFFKDLRLSQPDIYLGVGSDSQAGQTARVMIKLEPVLLKEKPDLVMVVGDVNSTLAGALTAAKLNIPIAHIEAGLRSFDRTMPEEINRIVTDRLSDFLFTTCQDANLNLSREGISKNKIYFTGNVMIDTLLSLKSKVKSLKTWDKLGLRQNNYALLTLHRPENVDNQKALKRILAALQEIQKYIKIIFPLHPRTEKNIKKFGLNRKIKNLKNLICLKPIRYLSFLNLMMNAKLVLTDSGGIQEETTVLGIPCLTLRKNTERPVTVTKGTNMVVGTNPTRILKETLKVIRGKGKTGRIPKFWDGRTAQRIVKILEKI